MAPRKVSGKVITKSMLNQKVAMLLGEKTRNVSAITELFIAQIREELAQLNTVRVDGLGILHVLVQRGAIAQLQTKHTGALTATSVQKYRVSFRKAAPLTRALRELHGGVVVEKNMDKLGVDEGNTDNEKLATEGCPQCGAKVERHGDVFACPTHGTEPFEKKTKK